MKCIGLITGPDATEGLLYLQELHAEVRRRKGDDTSAHVIIHHLDRKQFGWLDDPPEVGPRALLISTVAKKLKAAGAQHLLIGSWALHLVSSEVAAAVDLPVWLATQCTAAALVKLRLMPVGLIGTRSDAEENFWKRCLRDHGIGALLPPASDRKWIRTRLSARTAPEESRAGWIRIATELRHAGANALVLCTPDANAYLRDDDVMLPLVCAAGQQMKAAVDAASA